MIPKAFAATAALLGHQKETSIAAGEVGLRLVSRVHTPVQPKVQLRL